jgi:hypothetical protein
MAKLAVVVLSGQDNPTRASAGLHVAKRMHDARDENGIEAVEVFLFTEGLKVVGETDSDLGRLIQNLLDAGIVVGGCTTQLNDWNLADQARAAGIRTEFARDTFSRYARDGWTVLTF